MPTLIRTDGSGTALPSEDALITEARSRQALVTVAHIIAVYGEVEYLPLMERLEAELARYRDGRDPRSRALAILKAYEATENDNAAAR